MPNLTEDHYSRFDIYKGALRSTIGEVPYNAWLADLSLHEMEQGDVLIGAPSDFFAQQITQRYRVPMHSIWQQEMGFSAKLTVRGRNKIEKPSTRFVEKANAAAPRQNIELKPAKPTTPTQRRAAPKPTTKQVTRNGAAPRLTADTISSKPTRKGDKQMDGSIGVPMHNIAVDLNDAHTFSSFAISDSNRMAFRASQTLADGAEESLIYLFGKTGIGKTHLLSAIGHTWLSRRPDDNVMYVTHDNLLNGYVSAVMSRSVPELRAYLDKIDVLLVDDIHMLRGRKSTQEELLLLIDRLIQRGKKIVITGGLEPNILSETGLCQRFTDRLAGGICVGIGKPDTQLRLAIATSMADRWAASGEDRMPERHIETVALRCDRSVRELQGCMRNLRFYLNTPRSEAFTDQQIEDLISFHINYRQKNITMEIIITAVSDLFGVSMGDIRGKRRPQRIVRARHAINLLARKLTKTSLKAIGAAMSRDHTTVMASVRRAEALAESDEDFADKISILLEELT